MRCLPCGEPIDVHESSLVGPPLDTETTGHVEASKGGMAVQQSLPVGVGVGRRLGGPEMLTVGVVQQGVALDEESSDGKAGTAVFRWPNHTVPSGRGKP